MHLTDCFIDLIAYVAYFMKSVSPNQPPHAKVKAEIDKLISYSQQVCVKCNFSPEDYILARFAVFAWVDEAILSSGWNETDSWRAEQLQQVYCQTTNAGELFFDRLNTVGPQQRDVREVYYLCLAMGFTGRYCHPGDEILLDQLKSANLKLLSGSSDGLPLLEERELFPEAYAAPSGAVSPGKTMFPCSNSLLQFSSDPLYIFLRSLQICFEPYRQQPACYGAVNETADSSGSERIINFKCCDAMPGPGLQPAPVSWLVLVGGLSLSLSGLRLVSCLKIFFCASGSSSLFTRSSNRRRLMPQPWRMRTMRVRKSFSSAGKRPWKRCETRISKKMGNPLYALPCYLVIGESGSGKTTSIKSARLSSPFAESQP